MDQVDEEEEEMEDGFRNSRSIYENELNETRWSAAVEGTCRPLAQDDHHHDAYHLHS